jgi:Ca2+-binding EF-hand superfamily protein
MERFAARKAAIAQEESEFMVRVKAVFERWDEESKGYLTREQTKLAIISLMGIKPTRCELNQLCGAKTGPIPLDLQRFVDSMRDKYVSRTDDDDTRQAFKAFDRFNNGFLTIMDVKAAFKEVAPKIQESLAEQVFYEFDDDHDGRINYAQFWRMWCRR